MKLRILIIAFISISLVACDEDFLEKTPIDSLSPEVFYGDAANLETGLAGVYDALQDRAFFGSLQELDGITDNGIPGGTAELSDFINFGKGIVSATAQPKIPEIYQSAYQVIQRANLLIANINAPGSTTQAVRTTVEYEARGLRALAYMRLAYLFGSVPLVTTPIFRSDALALSTASNEEVVEFVLKELNEVAANLAVKPYNNQAGRLTKIAALAFRAKILVFEARKGKKSWNDALTALKEVTTLAETNGVKLFTTGDGTNGQVNFETLFSSKGENNAEILFVVKGNQADPLKSVFRFYSPAGGNLELSVHTNLVNDFYTTDGLPITNPTSIYSAATPYVNRDPRLQASIILPGSMYSNGLQQVAFNGRGANARLQTNFAVRKAITLDGLTPNLGELDAIVLRYADVLLLLAEAENEVNGPTTAAYDAINKVRARVKMPNVAANLAKEAFRAEVLHERRVELAFEGHRWYDLVTSGIADKAINGIKELDRVFVPNKQELFPIPQSEIDLNPKLTQNSGY